MDDGGNWRQLSLYVYQNEKMKAITLEVIKLIKEYRGIFKNVMIDKSWIYGPSLKVQVNSGNDEKAALKRNELFLRIKNVVKAFEDKYEKVDYRKHEIMSKRLALIENYKGTILPLRNNYTVIEEDMKIESINTIYDKDLYVDMKNSIAEFLCDSYEWFSGLSEDDKDIYILKLMIVQAHYDKSESKDKAGIKYGYLTYRSHYEGFNKQLKENTKSKEAMLSMIENKSQVIKDFQKEQFAHFLESIQSEFINYHKEDRNQMIIWLSFVKNLLTKFEDALNTGKVKFHDYHDISFFLSQGKDLSDFHKNLAANPQLVEVMKSKTILMYRLCINTFYTILPFFSISPLKKHVLCKHVCDAVENHFDMNYMNIMEERVANYM